MRIQTNVDKKDLIKTEHPIRTWLRLRRETAGTFAEEMGISPSFLSHLLAGRRGPSAAMMLKLARATGIPPEALLKPGTEVPRKSVK